jgi:hypothetical protein
MAVEFFVDLASCHVADPRTPERAEGDHELPDAEGGAKGRGARADAQHRADPEGLVGAAVFPSIEPDEQGREALSEQGVVLIKADGADERVQR